jgi:hypothetical protein
MLSNLVYFKRRPSDSGGSRVGHHFTDGQHKTFYFEDYRADSAKKTKSFLDPRDVIEFEWEGASFSLTIQISEYESDIVERYPRAVNRALGHIHAFYFEGAFNHLSKDDPCRTPFIVEGVTDWEAVEGALTIVFRVSQIMKGKVAGKYDDAKPDEWKCQWYIKPVD